MATVRRQTLESLIEVEGKLKTLFKAYPGKPKKRDCNRLFDDKFIIAKQLELQSESVLYFNDFEAIVELSFKADNPEQTAAPIESAIKILAILGIGVTR